jgi:hypothetical protein
MGQLVRNGNDQREQDDWPDGRDFSGSVCFVPSGQFHERHIPWPPSVHPAAPNLRLKRSSATTAVKSNPIDQEHLLSRLVRIRPTLLPRARLRRRLPGTRRAPSRMLLHPHIRMHQDPSTPDIRAIRVRLRQRLTSRSSAHSSVLTGELAAPLTG